jgi:aldose 1-epimerase
VEESRRFAAGREGLMQRALLAVLLGLCLIAAPAVGADKAVFGTTAGGEEIFIYTLTNNNSGMEARVSNYGAILVSLKVPDRDGALGDILLGFNTLDEYLKHRRFGGTIAGRHAGRLSGGRITLNGVEYELTHNEGQDNVHGGANDFDTRVWQSRDVSSADEQRVELTYLSKDGEEGFPGNLQATVVYSLTDRNELRLDFSATTDKDTVVNLMNHPYLNLAGEGEGDILGHVLTIHADEYSPLDSNRVTTGKLESVKGTPFDLRKPAAIGSRINQDHEQLRFGRGFDHHFIL